VKEFKAVRKLRIKGNTIASPTYSELVFKWLRCPIHIICGCITAKLSSRIIVPSKVTGYEIVEDYLADPKKIKVVNNGVSLDSLEVGKDEDPEVCLHIPDDHVAFVFVGRFRIRKGVQYLVEAFDRVRANIDKVTLMLIGTGEQEGAIKKMVARKGLTDLVLFAGKLSRRQIFRLFDFCHVFVLPSLYEGLPFTILEAMLYGLPVCASKVSGNPEVVRHGETGFLHRCEDVEKLTEHMMQLTLNPGLREEMGKRGRLLALEKFSHRKLAERYSEEYSKVLEM
jgi:glycosyltransferase involved in cell wall biosynthesis